MSIFVNFSNHPSSSWGEAQIAAAEKYGKIIDVPFPILEANYTEEDIKKIGEKCVVQIMEKNPNVVMCQGEFTLTFYVVNELKKREITCVSACTRRVSKETKQKDGSICKKSLFLFEGFRKYV